METYTNNKGNTLKFKSSLSEITVREYQKLTHHLTESDFTMSDIEEFKLLKGLTDMETMKDAKEHPELSYEDEEQLALLYSNYIGNLSDGLKVLAPDEIYRNKIDDLLETEVVPLFSKIQIHSGESAKKGTQIHVPGINDQQIDDLKEYLDTIDKKIHADEYTKTLLRIESLEKHILILHEVQESAFIVYVQQANIRKSFTKLPESIEGYCEKRGISLEEYIQQRDRYFRQLKSRKDRLEFQARDRALRTYQSEINNDTYKNIHQLLSLLLVPPREDFSMKYAKVRAEYLLDVKMDVVLPLVNFIEAALRSWKSSSALSFRVLPAIQSQKGKTLGKSGDGFM
ncbi:MAG: hypothetical protein AAFO96_03635 [Bacteroidota bacterium]